MGKKQGTNRKKKKNMVWQKTRVKCGRRIDTEAKRRRKKKQRIVCEKKSSDPATSRVTTDCCCDIVQYLSVSTEVHVLDRCACWTPRYAENV